MTSKIPPSKSEIKEWMLWRLSKYKVLIEDLWNGFTCCYGEEYYFIFLEAFTELWRECKIIYESRTSRWEKI